MLRVNLYDGCALLGWRSSDARGYSMTDSERTNRCVESSGLRNVKTSEVQWRIPRSKIVDDSF